MKLRLSATILILLAAGCSNSSPEETLIEQEEYKSELEGLLQTEQVRNQQLALHLENLDTQIVNFERDRDNPNVEKYVETVTEYAGGITENLNKMDEHITAYRNGEQLNTGDVVKTRDAVADTVEKYEAAVGELELTDVLEREHSNVVLANEEITEAVNQIADALAAEDDELLNEAIERLQSATEYL
ncbi:hypothetical protein [Jeotgalicoccus halotolerans]|uniref:Cell-wall binding lipoprotein n=1 Tax=Jeotgalicoccus halotolerans TaxID=157227 RepID=A0A3E0B151_9STAP|nr:hypothetical protein [Jeotgalicoccus halotolerans]REG25678.1 hypothetical protein DFR63_0721 [Jeotgalicoccus halotolerans]